ncbi:MAG: glycosyltransferase [Planctomycetes bacterium]|nr:glycosyltransferase [Planctomycetota bacterium]
MIFGENYRVREIELATRLARHTPVFALDHTPALRGLRPTIGEKLRLRVDLLRSPFEVLSEGQVTRFRMPIAAATGPTLNEGAAAINERHLQQALKRFDCDTVYLSTPFFFLPSKRRDYRIHFDVVDNFHDAWPATRVGRARREFHAEVLRRADSVSASSLQLCDYVQRLADRQPVYIPNGVPLAQIAAVDAATVDGIRKRFQLDGKFTVGFIANHTMPFDGMERLVRAFVQARSRRPELALLVVGPGAERAAAFSRGEADGVLVAGAVPPDEVAAWFAACDAGAHPQDVSPLTHDAMAMNPLEFSAAGKPVLSNPLKEFQRLALPNIQFTDDDSVAAWAAALADPSTFAPFDKPALASAIAAFDWERSAETLAGALGIAGEAPAPRPPSKRLLDIVHYERKPLADYHSIEKLFAGIRGAMLAHADVRVARCPEASRGVMPRLRNKRWASLAQGRVNHIVGDVHYLALGLDGDRTVLTVHDCVALRRTTGLRRALLRKLYFEWPVARARIVTTISQATKDELVTVTGCDPEKIRVVPNCVADAFQYSPREFNTERPLVLLIGTLPHKNLNRTVEALTPLQCRLHVVGRLSAVQRAMLAESGLPFENSIDLSGKQMANAYRECDAVGFASLYEGFGMPVIEGQATGRAVVTSNLAPMTEVAGSGACFVNPTSVESIRDGYERVFGDAEYRAGLIANGLHNVERFRPDAVAAMYLDIYREILG